MKGSLTYSQICRSDIDIVVDAKDVQEDSTMIGKHTISTDEGDEMAHCVSFHHPGIVSVGGKV